MKSPTLLRSSWYRFLRLWRPMAVWTLLVWLFVGVTLGPLLSWLFGRIVFRGDRVIVGNEDLLDWLLRPEGAAYLVVAGGIAIMGAVIRYAGLFRILTDDLSAQPVSVRQTLLELLPDLPALFRLCLAAVTAALIVLAPLVAGLWAIYHIWLGEFDVNYYLAARPAEWERAMMAAAVWAAVWVGGVVYVLLHTLPALPAFLDGHRPLHVALRRSWALTRKNPLRSLWLLLLCIGLWYLTRAILQGLYFLTVGAAVEALLHRLDSVTLMVLATGAWAAGSVALDAAVSFVGFTLSATVLTKFYYEDTDLHQSAAPVPLGLGALPKKIGAFLLVWIQPVRALPVLAVVILLSGALSSWLIERVPEYPSFTVTAHRAGMLLETENTLAALEKSIEAEADFAEIDVQRTRDGVVVVIHDLDLMRLAGDPRRIDQTDYADLAGVVLGRHDASPPEERQLATLAEFLERARGRIGLNIELKYYGPDPQLAEDVVGLVREREMEAEVVIMSLSLSAVRQVQRLAPEITTGYLATLAAGHLTRLPVGFLAVGNHVATDRLLRTARRRGMEVHVWTLNQASAMLDAVERGVDGIITDDPALAVRLRNELAMLTMPERLLLQMRRVLPDLVELQAELVDSVDQ